MNVREWALISFTILAQMSVGSFLVLGAIHLLAQRRAGMEAADRLADRALLAIGPVLVLGMIASLLHLGNPFAAYRAVTNVASSWLSREILFTVLFGVAGASFAFMQWRKMRSFTVRNIVAWIAGLIGLGLVYSMTQVYMLRTVPVWDSFATPVSFFVTTFLLGALAVGSALVATYAYLKRKDPDCAEEQCVLVRQSVRWIAVASIVLVGIEFVLVPLQVAYLASGPGVAATAADRLFSQYGVILALRLALVFLGAGILAAFLYQLATNTERDRLIGNLTYAAFVLVLVGEVLGRFLFYNNFGRLGI